MADGVTQEQLGEMSIKLSRMAEEGDLKGILDLSRRHGVAIPERVYVKGISNCLDRKMVRPIEELLCGENLPDRVMRAAERALEAIKSELPKDALSRPSPKLKKGPNGTAPKTRMKGRHKRR